ncbi:MAG: [FeFe] hydrogenase H-cluster radical SAM maturase HydE [Desulforhabdus sp.]|jgi:biotin synthase|nr:[FeFe] hydrogenase H-cluster radical SAM maturase HydE [Desulforhabdus sp.]
MNRSIAAILRQQAFSEPDIAALLSATQPEDVALIQRKAESVLLEHCGPAVYFRGLIEFSNICSCNCRYCGIRRENSAVRRYQLTADAVLDAALRCAGLGFGSLVLQSGERRDEDFVEYVEKLICIIKQRTRSEALPDGLGITLCVGEQSPGIYRRFFGAGSHRYLLRIETSSPRLFKRLHPSGQSFHERLECLRSLREIGYQVGTGVMIGAPGQTVEDLARDVLFFRDEDVDMIGMGPYIPHPQTPAGRRCPLTPARRKDLLRLSLLMIAVVRIVLRDVNIAATTALQTLDAAGRELGLRFGANVMMPQITPKGVRRDYSLYEGKPLGDIYESEQGSRLEERLRGIGRKPGVNEWGDSPHFAARGEKENEPGGQKPYTGALPQGG